MLLPDYRRQDGSIDYKSYMQSREWRRFREGYWKRNRDRACQYCGMTDQQHQRERGTHLHLHHRHYATLGCETDEDLECLCKRCHLQEHGGPDNLDTRWSPVTARAGTDWETTALEKIQARRSVVHISYDPESEELWKKLAWLVEVEVFVRNSKALKEEENQDDPAGT